MGDLASLLADPGILIVPGAYDALSARIAAQSGAKAVYMTGFGVAGASFGVPDIGLIGAEPMTERVRALAGAIAPVPLIADGDNGHGGPLNTARLTRAYEQAGAACIQIEDQVLPKRCGHMDGKQIVPLDEAVARIRAAVDARTSPAFKIMARTDARATDGLDEALKRGEAFAKAGADILFIEAPASEAELKQVAGAFKGMALVANMVEDGKTPYLPAAMLEDIGFRIALYPVSALLAAARTLQERYAELLNGNGLSPHSGRVRFAEYNDIVGLNAYLKDADAYSR